MPPLAPLDANARPLKQARLSFEGKHARVSSDASDEGYTSGPESTRVHPSSQPALEDDERPLKKRLRRTLPSSVDSSDDEDQHAPVRDARAVLPSQRRTGAQISAVAYAARRGIAPATALASLTRRKVDQSAILSSYISNDTLHTYRITSEQDGRTFAPPFACAFSWASLRGGKQMMAVSDEEGNVCFIDADRNAHEDRAQGRVSMKAHENAIFDVRWSTDDSILATASGDQTVGLTDVQTQRAVGRLVGHLSSVKQIAWDPSNPSILATGSRDGSIRIWDTRLDNKKGSGAQTNFIRNAHALAGAGRSLNKTPRSASRSVTSVSFLSQRDGLLASGGTADGIVKLWDLRKTHSKRANPTSVAASHDLTKGRGVSCLVAGTDNARLHVLGIDNSLYTLDPIALAYGERVPPTIRRSGGVGVTSFYVRCAASPCGRFVVSGSSKGEALLWDTEAPAAIAPIRLAGHVGEVGAVDWGHETIATCGDDLQVRLWRPDLVTSRRCRADAELRKWHWSGAWPVEAKA